jgi:endoplasmic reticulum chaperone BiP
MTKDCHLLGQFDLTGINLAPKGQPQIIVTFDIDENGIVKVTAEDKASKNKKEITIEDRNSGRLTQEEIDRMVREAEEKKDEDIRVGAKVGARNDLRAYIDAVRKQIDTAGASLASDDKTDLENTLSEVSTFVDELDLEQTDTDEIENKRQEVEEKVVPLLGASKDEEKDEL